MYSFHPPATACGTTGLIDLTGHLFCCLYWLKVSRPTSLPYPPPPPNPPPSPTLSTSCFSTSLPPCPHPHRPLSEYPWLCNMFAVVLCENKWNRCQTVVVWPNCCCLLPVFIGSNVFVATLNNPAGSWSRLQTGPSSALSVAGLLMQKLKGALRSGF